jgi:hypothetical protein
MKSAVPVSSKFSRPGLNLAQNLRATLAQVKMGRPYNSMARSAQFRQFSLLTILLGLAGSFKACQSSPTLIGGAVPLVTGDY